VRTCTMAGFAASNMLTSEDVKTSGNGSDECVEKGVVCVIAFPCLLALSDCHRERMQLISPDHFDGDGLARAISCQHHL